MGVLIWIGSAMTLAGVAGIVWCIVAVQRARRAGLDDDALRARMQKVVAVNLGALGLSVLGLMAVILGLNLR
jgi:hypothetical protein